MAHLWGGERTFASNPTLSKQQIYQISLFASLYLLFFTLNFIFPTQSDDLGAGFGGLSVAYKSYMTWNGRLGDIFKVAFGSYIAHTPLYPFINALFCVAFIYLFFILIFARLPFMGDSRIDSASHSHDIGVICFILICLFAFKGFGSVFYWAAGSLNYLWAWVFIMAWCVPFRLFWGEIFAKDSGESSADSSESNAESSAKSHIFSMLILGLIAGWGSEFGIVLIVFQVAFIAFALQRRIKLPAWYYVGVVGFIAGWLILYFSPGHAARGNIVNALNNDISYVTISKLLSMPFVDIFKRFAGTFSKDPMGLTWIAVVGLLAFLRFGLNMRKRSIAILGIVLLVAYAVPITKFIFVILVGLLCLWGGFALQRINPQSANRTYLFALFGLFVAYFLATAATIQMGVPARAKLPYLLLGMAQIIIAWLLLKPYLARFAKMISVGLCAICAIYSLFVVSESITMRLKWERMLASIEAQKALGQTNAIISADTFRSNYRGYGDWGNPNKNTNEWPNTTYAKVFGVEKFIVKDK